MIYVRASGGRRSGGHPALFVVLALLAGAAFASGEVVLGIVLAGVACLLLR